MSKFKLLVIVGSLLIVAIITGVSYSLWMLTIEQTRENVVIAGCFEIVFTEDSGSNISLNNSYPLTDIEGDALVPYTFSIQNTCSLKVSYDINLELLSTTTLDDSLVKVKLDGGNPYIINTKDTAVATITDASAYRMETFYLNEGEINNHQFRMWIDESGTSENAENKVVDAKIVITAVPETVVPDASEVSACKIDYQNRGLVPTGDSYFKYDELSNEVWLTEYSNDGPKDVVIPCEINDKPVTILGPDLFSKNINVYMANIIGLGYQLTSVVIPSTVRIIAGEYDGGEFASNGYGAFYNNLLTEIVIPEGVVEIGVGAFALNMIDGVEIPNSVTTIYDYAFYSNHIVELNLGNSLTAVGPYVFANNYINDLIIPDNVLSVGNNAFANNNIQSLTLSNGMTSLSSYLFENNNIKNFVIPSNIIEIQSYAFSNNSFTNVNIPAEVMTIGSYAFDNIEGLIINVEGKSSASDFTSLGSSWNGAGTINYLGP